MRSLYDFIIKPIGGRYNNTKKIGDKELIINTEIFNHQYINRTAEVLALPILVKTDVKVGDTVVVHHNVFRRWHNAHGKEQNSSNYIKKDMYAIRDDQIFAYKRNTLEKSKTCGGEVLIEKKGQWEAADGFCFIKPIKSYDKLSVDKEQPYVGIMKYTNISLPNIQVGDLVGFTPSSEYEFIIDGERLYRVFTSEISIKYEYQGQEEEYNPSWLQSSR